MKAKTILVTGAAGLVGAEVTARLAGNGHAVVALTHARPELLRNNGRRIRTAKSFPPAPGAVAAVAGDVTSPGLGLPPGTHDALQRATDHVVHCAATTDFGRSWQVYEDLNIGGTRNVLEFTARAGGHPIPLTHVSTAYVCGERIGTVREDELDAGQKFGTDYERSKFMAEQMVMARSADAEASVAVVRPSIVVGNEQTGVVREFKNVYVVLKILTEGRVRSIPGYYDATLDLVSVGRVADVVVRVTERIEESAGKTFHAIGAQPHTLRDFSDVLAEYPTFHVPRYVPPQSFDVAQLPPGERIYYERVMALYESYFRRRIVFSADAATELMGGAPTSGGKPHLRKILDYCLRVGYLGAPMPDVEEVLARLSAADGGSRAQNTRGGVR